MKRVLSLVLALMLALSLCACGEKDTAQPPSQETACDHVYAEATCTAPKTCTKCGATEGEPAGHTLTAICTACDHVNEGFRDLCGEFEWSFVDGKAGDEDLNIHFYGFHQYEGQSFVNVAHERYTTLTALAADREMTVEAIRAEYKELEDPDMIKTYFDTEYGYNGWGVGFEQVTFVEDGYTVTLTAVEESWDADDNHNIVEKTSVWTRTGLAEYTVTGGDYIPVGSVLTPAS